MMRTRIGLAAIVAVAATAMATGAALALSESGSPGGSEGAALLASGTTSGGEGYTISRLSQDDLAKLGGGGSGAPRVPSHMLCTAVLANGMGGAGCLTPPDTSRAMESTQTTLGEDMVVQVLAGASVEAVEIRRLDEVGGVVAASEPVDVGSGRLFHALLRVPAETLPVTKGLPGSPVVEITARNTDGAVVNSQRLDPSGPGVD